VLGAYGLGSADLGIEEVDAPLVGAAGTGVIPSVQSNVIAFPGIAWASGDVGVLAEEFGAEVVGAAGHGQTSVCSPYLDYAVFGASATGNVVTLNISQVGGFVTGVEAVGAVGKAVGRTPLNPRFVRKGKPRNRILSWGMCA